MIRNTILLIIALFAISACGPKIVKGQPPFISISSLTATDEELSADFDLRNINGVEMVIDSIEIRVEIADAELTRYNGEFDLTIGPNGTEEVHVNELPEEFGRDLLSSLESGEVLSLPFKLEGRVHTRDDGYLRFDHVGHLYPIPGRPGQFRSATTRNTDRDRR
jgi:hypothetical protein